MNWQCDSAMQPIVLEVVAPVCTQCIAKYTLWTHHLHISGAQQLLIKLDAGNDLNSFIVIAMWWTGLFFVLAVCYLFLENPWRWQWSKNGKKDLKYKLRVEWQTLAETDRNIWYKRKKKEEQSTYASVKFWEIYTFFNSKNFTDNT